ncbi:ABC transporter permease [Pseudofrankia sp. BMG5.37]|uniref:ABC transporter permease n=1 Tax=Pseudofrankia sp. BMG5.37 TaxID=3050035 RepID=UPI0028960929|nr:ABC transporter permease [Pseudofrankia sp. BMG5.37]MDT3440577.1 ABC transporter permease [Pseudofrankia sp. BMG5.37]
MSVQAPPRPPAPAPAPGPGPAPDGPARRGPAGGGFPARRAMVRWAWRMLRREWRSQVLVTLLLLLTVSVAVFGGTALYNAPPSSDPVLGTADSVYVLSARNNPQAVAADIATLRARFGVVDVVGHTARTAPGLALPVDYRAQVPRGTYTAQLLGLVRGRYPSGPGEAAITAGMAELLDLRLGGSVGLDGHPRTIVGIVENPSDLKDAFVLVAPSTGPPPSTASVFVGADVRHTDDQRLSTSTQRLGQGPDNQRLVIVTLILAGATILLLLVAFVAAAGFGALAHRRLRQLGMLAAVGATARHIRLVMIATGLLIGLVGAVAGTVAGLALWPLATGWLTSATGHRVDRLNIPWFLVGAVAVLAVAMSAAAAWWPARTVSRLPVTLALAGRPPAPRSTRRPAALAAVLLAVGLGCLAAGEKDSPALTVGGTLATALAIPFAAPFAIRLLGWLGARAPIAVRLALRDLARHQARAGAALAAISLALGVPVAIVIVATDIQATPTTGNLSDRQLIVRIARPGDPPSLIPIRTEQQLRDLSTAVGRMTTGLPGPTVLPLDMAYDPAAPAEAGVASGEPVRHAQEFGIPRSENVSEAVVVYVATPELLRLLGADPARIPASTEVVTSRAGHLVLFKAADRTQTDPSITRIRGSGYTSLPDTLLTAGAVRRWGLTPVRAGWLVESAQPFAADQLAAARRIAAEAGLTIEARDGQGAVGTVRAGSTAGGLLVALTVLAMAVGLIRGEGAADLRTLTATGATAGIRRTLTAATAGGLALLGVLLGTAGAGLGLLAVYRHDLAVFGRIPTIYPLLFLIGVPLAAAVGGWLVAGKEPVDIARRRGD